MIPQKAILLPKPQHQSHLCFGCSSTNKFGLDLDFYYYKDKVYSYFSPTKFHVGWGKITHGRISATLCDESIGWISIFLFEEIIVTKELNVKYFTPISVNEELTIISSLLENHPRYPKIQCTIYNKDEKKCVEAIAIISKLNNKLAKRFNIMDNHELELFSNFIKKIKSTYK